MLLTTLHWPDEIRALGELDLPAEEPEIKAGRAEDGRAAHRGDDRRLRSASSTTTTTARRCSRSSRPRSPARRPVAAPEAEPATNLVDLMAALEASVKAAVEARGTTGADPGRRGQVEEGLGRGGQAERGRGRGGPTRPASQERLAARCRPRDGAVDRPADRDAARAVPPQARLRQDARAGAGRRHCGRASPPAAGASSSSATARPGSTTTSASRSTACWSAGPSRADRRSTRASAGWRSTSRTTRSSTSTSRG